MKNTIETFSALGARLLGFGDDDATRAVIDSACRANGWFTPADIRRAVRAIACDMLQREKLVELALLEGVNALFFRLASSLALR